MNIFIFFKGKKTKNLKLNFKIFINNIPDKIIKQRTQKNKTFKFKKICIIYLKMSSQPNPEETKVEGMIVFILILIIQFVQNKKKRVKIWMMRVKVK